MGQRRHVKYDGFALSREFRQQLFQQERIQRFAIDSFPARVRCADANTLRRNQQHTLVDADIAATLPDQLRKIRRAGRRAVDFFVDLVNERQLTFGFVTIGASLGQLVVDAYVFSDQLGRRLQDGLILSRRGSKCSLRPFADEMQFLARSYSAKTSALGTSVYSKAAALPVFCSDVRVYARAANWAPRVRQKTLWSMRCQQTRRPAVTQVSASPICSAVYGASRRF